MSRTKSRRKRKKPLNEQTIRAIRRAYRPGIRIRTLEKRFQTTGVTIISIANRATYTEYESRTDEYEPPPHIRGTRRREQPTARNWPSREPIPILRNDIRHLLPEAIRAIREALDDGEPIPRTARSFGLKPEAIAHMKRPPRQ